MSLLSRPHVFERGDKVYLTTPLTLGKPTDSQVEEYAFSSAVKSSAPNEHIGWVEGRYVEAGRANLNNAMWLSDELALKSLTPMLMPVTVMHDPRTAVGTIADCKLVGMADAEAASTSRIDTALAIWKHRFPEIWAETEHNIKEATMMQSMECFSPSYCCSECGQQYIKLHEGKEQASWCEHLRGNSSRRILQDVCFTGTGLIFGTRGGQGAYTEAYLDHFQDEIAEYHDRAHIDGKYQSSERSTKMGFVQIDETELANLRKERDTAVAALATKTAEHTTEVAGLTTKVETAEAATVTEKDRADAAVKEKADLEATAQQATLKDKRVGALGDGFLAKLGEFTRDRLTESAGTLSDEDWESALKEKEEMAGVKRDLKTEGAAATAAAATAAAAGEPAAAAEGTAFSSEELANFTKGGGVATTGASTPSTGAARAVARAFSDKRKPAAPAAAK